MKRTEAMYRFGDDSEKLTEYAMMTRVAVVPPNVHRVLLADGVPLFRQYFRKCLPRIFSGSYGCFARAGQSVFSDVAAGACGLRKIALALSAEN